MIEDFRFDIASMRDVSFERSCLKRCSFPTDAQFQRTTFKGAVFIDTVIGSNLDQGLDLSGTFAFVSDHLSALAPIYKRLGATMIEGGANLHGVNLKGLDLTQADLNGVDLSEATLQDCNLSNTTFVGANLTNATFKNVRLENTLFFNNKTAGVVFEDVMLRGAISDNPEIVKAGASALGPNTSLRSLKIFDVDFSFKNLESCKFNSSQITRSSFDFTNLTESCFDSSRIEDSIFTHSILKNASLERTTIQSSLFLDASFESAYLVGAVFKDCDLNQPPLGRSL